MRGRGGEKEAPLAPPVPSAPPWRHLLGEALRNHPVVSSSSSSSAPSGTPPAGPLVIHPLRTRAIYRGVLYPAPPTHTCAHQTGQGESSLYTCGSHLTRPSLKQGCVVGKQPSEICTTLSFASFPLHLVLQQNSHAPFVQLVSLTDLAHRCGPNWQRRKDAGHSPRGWEGRSWRLLHPLRPHWGRRASGQGRESLFLCCGQGRCPWGDSSARHSHGAITEKAGL